MDPANVKNYTPLNINNFSKKSKSSISPILVNLSSFLIALGIVGQIFLTRQASKPTNIRTQAAQTYYPGCDKNLIHKPTQVTANTQTVKGSQEIKSGDTISASEITISWESVPNAVSYYANLNEDPGVPQPTTDPVLDIAPTTNTSKKFYLKPNKSYYFYVRARSMDNKISVDVPNQAKCRETVPAFPTLNFKTSP